MTNKLLLSVLITTFSYAITQAQEQQEATIECYALSEITVDGNSNDWQGQPRNKIENSFKEESPTLKSAYWSAMWEDYGLYVLVEVSDDHWYPSWISAIGWEFDRIEIYIDMSYPQQDGLGAKDLLGNYQISPNFSETNQGKPKEFTSSQFPEGNGIIYADTYDGQGNYSIEYYIPFTAIPTNTDWVIDPYVTTTIGLDVTIVDVDNGEEKNRAVWSNIGDWDESWNNCDQVGLVVFSCLDVYPISNAVKNQSLKVLNSNVITDNIYSLVDTKILTVYNGIGSRVFEGYNNNSIDVSFLKEGVYIVKILDTNNELYTEKIIKL